jgi:hypothetical protein
MDSKLVKFYSPQNKIKTFFSLSKSNCSLQSCKEASSLQNQTLKEYPNENKNDLNITHLNIKNNKSNKNKILQSFPRSKEIEELFLKRKAEIKKLSHYRKIVNRNTRAQLLQENIHLKQISNCNSRVILSKIFQRINKKMKFLLEKYVKDWMIYHLHIRQIKQFDQLMRHRQILFESIEDPSLLVDGPVFENNLIKNFCKGFVHFVAMYKNELATNNLL